MQTRRICRGLVCTVRRARRVISEQLTQLDTAPNSEVTNALRGDLHQILTSYSNPGMYPSSRNHALSMALGHSSQRSAGYSSRPNPRSSGAGIQSSGHGPYSTSIQSDFADRSISAQDMGKPTSGELPNRDPDPHSLQGWSRDLTLASQTGLLGLSEPLPGWRPIPTAGRATDSYPTGSSFSETVQQSKQLPRAGLPRATSDASAAGMSPVATAR